MMAPAQDQLQAAPSQSQTSSTPASTAATQPSTEKKVVAYTLPPDLYKKAHDRSRIHFRLALIGFVYGLAVLWVVLRSKLAASYRDWAEAFSGKRFLQSVVFSPLLLLTTAFLTLPLEIYGEWVEKKYRISVQRRGSWSWDWVKAELIPVVVGTILIWLLYVVIRRSPRRWWFYFWLVALPIGVFVFFIAPWVIDPMFHKFEPLQQKDPALTASLENMVQRAGENIPPEPHVLDGRRGEDNRFERLCNGNRCVQTDRRLGYHNRQNEHSANCVRHGA